jgi:RNA polymerase sigma factor (sigma-70 family)
MRLNHPDLIFYSFVVQINPTISNMEEPLAQETTCFQFTTANYEALVKSHWRKLFAIAYRRLRDDDLAKDMVQEVFTYCWEQRDIIRIHTSVEAYLRVSLQHVLFAHFRKLEVESKAFSFLYQRMIEVESHMRDILTEQDLTKSLTDEMENMPSTMREIFKLRMCDHSVEEIAQSLDIANKTVKNNLSLGLNRLRKVIAKDFPAICLLLYILLT